MSNNTNGKAKSAAAQKAAANAAAAQQRFVASKSGVGEAGTSSNTKDLKNNPMYFRNIDPNSVRVEVGKKDQNLHISFEAAGGARKSGNQQKNSTSPYLPAMLVAAMSRLCKEGNLGVEYDIVKKQAYVRRTAVFSLVLRMGTTESGYGGDEQEAEAEAALKWIFEVECAILRKLYDLNLPDWADPCALARTSACADLWRDIKDAKNAPLPDQEALERLIATDTPAGKKAAARVNDRARDLFVQTTYKQKKKNVQCAPDIDAETGKVIGHLPLFANRKCYKFIDGKYEVTAHKDSNGPSLQELATTRENWSEIQRRMKAIDREYQPAVKLHVRNQLQRCPTMTIYDEVVNPVTAERTLVPIEVRDPFWNPLLETGKGTKLDSLVRAQISFRIKRGKSNNDYGIKVDYKPEIHLVHQEPRPTSDIGVNEEDDVGLYQDPPSDDEGETVTTFVGIGTAPRFEDEPVPAPQQAAESNDPLPIDMPPAEREEGEVDPPAEPAQVDETEEAAANQDNGPDEGDEQGDEAENGIDQREAEQDADQAGDGPDDQDQDEDSGKAEADAETARLAEEAARLAAEAAQRAAKAGTGLKRKTTAEPSEADAATKRKAVATPKPVRK